MIINIYISPGQPLSGYRFVQSVNSEMFLTYHNCLYSQVLFCIFLTVTGIFLDIKQNSVMLCSET
jgi:hypothetical protein